MRCAQQAVLQCERRDKYETRATRLLVDLLEDLQEASVVLLQNGVLRAHVQRPAGGSSPHGELVTALLIWHPRGTAK